MQEAARELAAGHGEKALALQREAQRLLDQSRFDRSTDPEPQGEAERKAEEQESEPRDDRKDGHGDGVAVGGDVPSPDEHARAEEFRRRVLEGLSADKSERLSPAVRRYAEGLLR